MDNNKLKMSYMQITTKKYMQQTTNKNKANMRAKNLVNNRRKHTVFHVVTLSTAFQFVGWSVTRKRQINTRFAIQ